eukprot:1721471-Prymnesium_polylepis.2
MVQRRTVLGVGAERIGTRVEQQPQHVGVAVLGGDVERRRAVGRGRVDHAPLVPYPLPQRRHVRRRRRRQHGGGQHVPGAVAAALDVVVEHRALGCLPRPADQ